MRILYGVQATGNGHITRSRTVISKLKQAGHEVTTVLSGRPRDMLRWHLGDFEPYIVCKGLTFTVDRDRVDYWNTVTHADFVQLAKDIFSLPDKNWDLVITDYEPITARYAQKEGIKSIGISHQYAFKYHIPHKMDWISTLFVRNTAPADIEIGLHWDHFGYPILPPVLPDLDFPDIDVDPHKVLVYLPFEERDELVAKLAGIPAYKFYVYGHSESAETLGNVCLMPYDNLGFKKDLASSTYFFSNAGFQSSSEALALSKHLLVKPLIRQNEQESNGYVLELLGLGTSTHEPLEEIDIAGWLEGCKAKNPKKITFPLDVADKLARWICEGLYEKENLDDLSKRVWKANLPA